MKFSLKSALLCTALLFFIHGCSFFGGLNSPEDEDDFNQSDVFESYDIDVAEELGVDVESEDEEGNAINITSEDTAEEAKPKVPSVFSKFFAYLKPSEEQKIPSFREDERQPYIILDVPNFLVKEDEEGNIEVEEYDTQEQLVNAEHERAEQEAYKLLDDKLKPKYIKYNNYSTLDEKNLETVNDFITKFLKSEEFNGVVIAIPINPGNHGFNKTDGGMSNYYRNLLYVHYLKRHLYKTADLTMRVFYRYEDIPTDKVFLTLVKYDDTDKNLRNIGNNIYTSPGTSVEQWLEEVEEIIAYQEQQRELEEQQRLDLESELDEEAEKGTTEEGEDKAVKETQDTQEESVIDQ